MKKKKAKKFLDWFFEEEKTEDSLKIDEETIEINLFQILIIVAITAFVLFWMFGSYLESYKNIPRLSTEEYIDSKIELNYFENNAGLNNGDFKQGLKHWVSSDGGYLFPESKSTVKLDKKDFHSSPYSMKIESEFPANRYHYSKKKNKYTIDNAYGYKETDHWLGVLSGSHINVSLWYKGDVPRVAVLGLNRHGDWTGIISRTGLKTEQWKLLEFSADIDESVRAIALEITLNQIEGGSRPVLWIDDVSLEVKTSMKENLNDKNR